MTTTDKITLVAAIAGILSAVAALGALLIACLARKDSQKSAEAALRSAEATQRASELMAKQLEMEKEEQERQLQRQAAENRPLFNWRGAGSDEFGGGQYFEFINQGAVISDARAVLDNGLKAQIRPKEVIATGQIGKLVIDTSTMQRVPNVVNCSIEFLDKHGERGRIDLRLTSHTNGRNFDYPPEIIIQN